MLPAPVDAQINNRIARSSLAPRPPAAPPFGNQVAQGVFIDNVWAGINASGIGRPTGPGASAVTVMKCPVYADAFQAVLTPKQLAALGWSAARPPAATVEQAYLEWGAERARRAPFYGVCEGFTCATIAMLAARNSPLAPGTSVEWFGMVPNGVVGNGHAFTVVNRTPGSAPTTPATWGVNCLVVDQWYALQTGGPAAMYVNGPLQDAAYVAWLTSAGNVLKSVTGFTSGTYAYLNIPLL